MEDNAPWLSAVVAIGNKTMLKQVLDSKDEVREWSKTKIQASRRKDNPKETTMGLYAAVYWSLF